MLNDDLWLGEFELLVLTLISFIIKILSVHKLIAMIHKIFDEKYTPLI